MPALTKLPSDKPTGLMPGDFTPMWDKARIGANPEMDGADVPIDPKFIFVAVFNKITPEGDALRQTVDVTQKLIVKKWRGTEEYEAFCYVASIVPTPEYYAKHKNTAKEFRYAGGKGSFSGFVIYRTLTGLLVGVDNYRNGQRTRHDYFPQVTDQNEDSVNMVARMATSNISLQGGTPAAYSMSMEDDDICSPIVTDIVTCKPTTPSGHCSICGSYGGCSCWWPDNWGDHSGSGGNQGGSPDYNDGGNTGTGGGGGGGGNSGNTGNTPSVSTVFNATNLTESQKTEINSILSKLSSIGISNKVITQLMNSGKITLKAGTVSGHENSQGVYNKSENTITINWNTTAENGVRNAMIEETFHAYQYQTYGTQFNQRCFEFEAKVYGTIIINQYAPNPNGTIYLNPMVGLGEAFGPNFANDIKRYTGNFTHGISSGDMNTLYQDYGGYCTQYPAGDPNWEFKALENAQK